MSQEEPIQFSKTEVTIRPAANGWIIREGPKIWVYADQEALMKKLIEVTSNQRKTLLALYEQMAEARKKRKEDA